MGTLDITMSILVGLSGVINAFLGIFLLTYWVLFRTTLTNNTPLYLSFLSFMFALWGISEPILLLEFSGVYPQPFLWYLVFRMIVFLSSSFVPTAFLLFTWEFPDQTISRRAFWIIISITGVATGGYLIFDYPFVVDGFWRIATFIQVGAFILGGIGILIKRTFTYSGLFRRNLLFVSSGVGLLMAAGLGLVVVEVYITNPLLELLPNVLALLLVLWITYAIVTMNLLSLPLVMKQLLGIHSLALSAGYIQISLFLLGFVQDAWLIVGVLTIFVILAVLLSKNVFQQIETRRTLERKQERLSSLSEEKDRFLRTSSHQLRTPLTALNGYIEMAREESQDASAESRQLLSRLSLLTRRLQSIIQQLLAFNAISTESFELTRPEQIDLYRLLQEIQNVEEAMQPQTENLVTTLEGSGAPYLIFGDRGKLRAGLTNLVHNAFVYTESEVTISFEPTEQNITIHIADDGIGITAQEREKMFEPFSRGDKAADRDPNGSGLGVYLANKIIELHQGSLELESDGRGQGTTVHITLPRRLE